MEQQPARNHPTQLGDLTNLTELWLRSNNLLSGTIPAEIGSLTKLVRLGIGWNHLTGTIPSQIGNLTELEWLELGGNALTGSIPDELAALTNLRYLHVFSNELSGQIPAWTDPTLTAWLVAFDPLWNDGCTP